MQWAQTHLPSELRRCKVSDAPRQASHLKVLLLLIVSYAPEFLSDAGHLPARVVLETQVLPRDELEHSRDVLALVAGLGVAAEDEVGAGAGQGARVGVAEEVVAALDARLGLRDPAVGLGLEDLDPRGARRALLGRRELLDLRPPLFLRRFHGDHHSTKSARVKQRFVRE